MPRRPSGLTITPDIVLEIVITKATPAQREAGRRLWDFLLRENTRHEKTPAAGTAGAEELTAGGDHQLEVGVVPAGGGATHV